MNLGDDALQPSSPGGTHLRAIPPERLQQTLEAHEVWVRSRGRDGLRADLCETDLGRANLRVAVLMEANLQGADLDRAILVEARMQRADLQRASLRGANLQRASMQQANLQGADLFEANLEEASLSEANLQAVNLLAANLQQADLQRANLQRAFMKEAVLRGARLQATNLLGANLQEADLSGAELRRAVLHEANLAGANLRGADLQEAELQGSNLRETDLRQTDLRDTDLRGTVGLVASQLAGADLAGAELPEPIRAFAGVSTVRELAKQARRLFGALLFACFAAWLCVTATTDVMLLTNAPVALFPDLETPIPSSVFYKVVPLLLLAGFIYFHLHLQRLWEELAALPAVFPDGRPVDRVVYPWLLHGMVRLHAGRLRGQRPPLSRIQTTLCILLAWWLVPLTLLLLWLRYLPCHTRGVTLLHIAIAVSGIAFMVLFQTLTRNTLRARPLKRYKHGAVAIVTAFLAHVALSLVSLAVFTGVPPDLYTPDALQRRIAPAWSESDIRRLVPRFLTLIHASPFANLVEAEVSVQSLAQPGETDRLDRIKGAALRQTNLRYAKAQRAFLVNADLRGAILTGADLRDADLRGAQLQDADLRGAILYGTDLRYAKGLTKIGLSEAFTDSTTRLPEAFVSETPPASGR